MAGAHKVLGSLFNAVAPSRELQLILDADPGLFYEVGTGHAIFKVPVKAGTVTQGSKIPVNCMFEAYWLLKDGERVGFFFVSQFQTVNHGGYLVTWMANGAGRAQSVEVMLKTEDLVIFNYPNRGTLVISPLVNDDVQNIFAEQ